VLRVESDGVVKAVATMLFDKGTTPLLEALRNSLPDGLDIIIHKNPDTPGLTLVTPHGSTRFR
jgi:hypothetical protein